MCFVKEQAVASANLIDLNAENWDQEVVQSSVPVMVDFYSPT